MSGQNGPSGRPVSADLKVSAALGAELKSSAAADRQSPRRETCESNPESGNVHDNTGTYGPLLISRQKTNPLKSNKLVASSSRRADLKKDTEMKVHQEKSFRINPIRQIVGATSQLPEMFMKTNGLVNNQGARRATGRADGYFPQCDTLSRIGYRRDRDAK
jgi:hypothetical protein